MSLPPKLLCVQGQMHSLQAYGLIVVGVSDNLFQLAQKSTQQSRSYSTYSGDGSQHAD